MRQFLTSRDKLCADDIVISAARLSQGGDGIVDDSSITEATLEQLADRKAERKRLALAKAEARKPLDKMVKEEIKRLGRKLTQGEKNACSLKVHHPDLVDVWGDLQNRVKVIKPVTMEAHPSLKLTLLPFQKESLYWMRKQEEGPWKGGMLADESKRLVQSSICTGLMAYPF